jgi:hypothetical protein
MVDGAKISNVIPDFQSVKFVAKLRKGYGDFNRSS